jgi:branched-chain amino acid transport system ATP-binding protein
LQHLGDVLHELSEVPMTGEVGLAVRRVGVRFGGLVALDEVSFEVPPRSVVGVIGPNGAGKTTLFNVISGFVQPSSGEVQWDGDGFRPRPHRLVHSGIARTLQAVGLFSQISALENVMVGAAASRRSGFLGALLALPSSARDEARIRDEALALLERLDIADAADRLPATLPFPVQKQVALARALISRPRLLMLDEPAGGLGAEDIAALASLIRELPQQDHGCSVLLVEHHMDLVMDVCDQVVVLDFGRRVAAGTPEEVARNELVAAAYLGTDVPSEVAGLDLDDAEERR